MFSSSLLLSIIHNVAFLLAGRTATLVFRALRIKKRLKQTDEDMEHKQVGQEKKL